MGTAAHPLPLSAKAYPRLLRSSIVTQLLMGATWKKLREADRLGVSPYFFSMPVTAIELSSVYTLVTPRPTDLLTIRRKIDGCMVSAHAWQLARMHPRSRGCACVCGCTEEGAFITRV